jgi:hypothetical protein
MPHALPDPRLRRSLAALAEDALYVTLGRLRDGSAALNAIAERRSTAMAAIARGEGAVAGVPTATALPLLARPLTASAGAEWWQAMARAAASVGAAWFLPMRGAIDDGLSLEAEPRGLRAVLPIGQRALAAKHQAIGTFAVRAIHAVAAADGPIGDDERRALDALIEALALPDDVARVLRAEAPPLLATLATPADLEPKLARQLVEGALATAAADGLETDERTRFGELAAKLGIAESESDALVTRANEARDAQARDGRAAIDAIRYVLAPFDATERRPWLELAVALSIPPIARADARLALDDESATPLARAHDVDRDARAMALAAAWAAALAFDPTASARAVLEVRHDRVARELGSEGAGAEARARIDDWVREGLARSCVAIGV